MIFSVVFFWFGILSAETARGANPVKMLPIAVFRVTPQADLFHPLLLGPAGNSDDRQRYLHRVAGLIKNTPLQRLFEENGEDLIGLRVGEEAFLVPSQLGLGATVLRLDFPQDENGSILSRLGAIKDAQVLAGVAEGFAEGNLPAVHELLSRVIDGAPESPGPGAAAPVEAAKEIGLDLTWIQDLDTKKKNDGGTLILSGERLDGTRFRVRYDGAYESKTKGELFIAIKPSGRRSFESERRMTFKEIFTLAVYMDQDVPAAWTPALKGSAGWQIWQMFQFLRERLKAEGRELPPTRMPREKPRIVVLRADQPGASDSIEDPFTSHILALRKKWEQRGVKWGRGGADLLIGGIDLEGRPWPREKEILLHARRWLENRFPEAKDAKSSVEDDGGYPARNYVSVPAELLVANWGSKFERYGEELEKDLNAAVSALAGDPDGRGVYRYVSRFSKGSSAGAVVIYIHPKTGEYFLLSGSAPLPLAKRL